MKMTVEQEEAAFNANADQKLLHMDATLLAELDRLAADYDMTADMCLTQIMGLQAKRGGCKAIEAMAFEINYAWGKYKMDGRSSVYRALKQTCAEALAAADAKT